MIAKFHILALIFIFLFLGKAEGKTRNLSDYGYPAYNQVLREFFNKYSGQAHDKNQLIQFTKEPDGWHFQLAESLVQNSIIRDELFWSRANKAYNNIDYPVKDLAENSDSILDQYIVAWSPGYFFNNLPYFNYTGWEEDIIKDLKDANDLSDTLLNSLARAYCFYAADLLNNNSGLSDRSKRFKLAEGQNCLSTDQLNTYLKFEHMGIETYARLYKQNPLFENFVADAFNVYSNEIMSCFLNLRTYQNEVEARKELIPGLYDRFIIDVAKNMLNSCAQDAILITNGDTDTFPLLYLQTQSGFRTDVLVVNVSLLSSARYIAHLLRKVNSSPPIPLCHNKQVLHEGVKDIVYILNMIPDSKDLGELLGMVASTDSLLKFKYEGEFLDIFSTSRIKLEVNKTEILQNNVVCPEDSGLITNSIEWDLNRRALYKNDLVMLDMIECNKFQRPIYFASTLSSESILGLDNYLQLEGFARRLVPIFTAPDTNNINNPHINTTLLYKRLIHDFSYDYLSAPGSHFSDCDFRLLSNQRLIFTELANILLEEGDFQKSDSILNLALSLYSCENTPVDYSMVKYIEFYYKLNKIKQANTLAEAIFETNYQFVKKKISKDSKNSYEIRLAMYNMDRLYNLTNIEYPQQELGRKIKKAKEELQELYKNISD